MFFKYFVLKKKSSTKWNEKKVSAIQVLFDLCPQCTEVRFASFLSGGFTTMAVMNPPKKKLEKRTSVQWGDFFFVKEHSCFRPSLFHEIFI